MTGVVSLPLRLRYCPLNGSRCVSILLPLGPDSGSRHVCDDRRDGWGEIRTGRSGWTSRRASVTTHVCPSISGLSPSARESTSRREGVGVWIEPPESGDLRSAGDLSF